MDLQFPLILEEIGFLPGDVAAKAIADEDPVGYSLAWLASRGKIEEALEGLLARDLSDDDVVRVPEWCKRAQAHLTRTRSAKAQRAVDRAVRKARATAAFRAPAGGSAMQETKSAYGLSGGMAENAPTRPERACATPGLERRRDPTSGAPARHGTGSAGATPDMEDAPHSARPPAGFDEVAAGLSDRYELVGLLGRGGMGSVYEVCDRELNRTVALKLLERGTEIASRRLLAEARATALLEHPNILPSYTVGSDTSGRLYYTMRKVEGQTLHESLATLKVEPALRALVQAARGVAHAHRKGFVHRDLKPANVMLGSHGEVWVVDWGLVRTRGAESSAPSAAAGETRNLAGNVRNEGKPDTTSISRRQQRMTSTGDFLGTPAYLSPEQAEGRLDRVGPPTDIYGLGGILYEILTGSPPHAGEALHKILASIVEGKIVPPSERAPRRRIRPQVEAICLKAMAFDPTTRYPTADAFADDLARFLAGEPVSVFREKWRVRARAWARRHTRVLALAGVLAVGGASVWFLEAARTRGQARAAATRNERSRAGILGRDRRARAGLAESLERGGNAHAERLRLLAQYAVPFEEIFREEQAAVDREEERRKLETLATRTFAPCGDSEISRQDEAWRAAAAAAGGDIEALGDEGAEASRILWAQELEWSLELALATERVAITSAWIERLRQTERLDPENAPPFWRTAVRLANEMGSAARLGASHPLVVRARELLSARGTLVVGPVPPPARATLIEHVTTENPFGLRDLGALPATGATIELPLGSYRVEVLRGEDVFEFPALVERGRETRIEVVLPARVPRGLVWIPPGPYIAGEAGDRTTPRHRRNLDRGFFLGRTEVTFQEYLEFLRAVRTENSLASFLPVRRKGAANVAVVTAELGLVDAEVGLSWPVFGITRHAAEAFLEWRTREDRDFGYRLPTTWEWERAYRGGDGRRFPWGDAPDPGFAMVPENSQPRGPASAGTCEGDRSPFGILDLEGNLSEWSSSDPSIGGVAILGRCWGQPPFVPSMGHVARAHTADCRHEFLGFRPVAIAAERD
ncbi:MAG: SUMF1/EgtB/PvdO family nonheme iron enzyme [Planctomycetes bacterium]|nr:SUMF1/EgtB/PvdO family nonheme iron enzyme [Planctomycetota bacterium]